MMRYLSYFKNKIVKFSIFFWDKPWYLVAGLGVVIVILSIFLSFQVLRNDWPQAQEFRQENSQDQKILEELPRKVRRGLDGVFVLARAANLYPLAVIIDNFVEARPPAGLSKASLVIEAPVEAGISRFMAVFATDEELKEMGPVRSARPYFLDWAQELGALFVHIGGSPEALSKISDYGIFNLNEFYWTKFFWRASSRERPFNVYTSSELLGSFLDLKGVENVGDFAPWLFKEDSPPKEANFLLENETVLTLRYRDDDYKVEWKYDGQENAYIRYQAGAPHEDVDGSQIKAKNVAVQRVLVWILDEVGRRRLETIGEGDAVFFQDGRVIEGTWQKESRRGRTRFYDETGVEIAMNAGPTWIEVVTKFTLVKYSKPDVE